MAQENSSWSWTASNLFLKKNYVFCSKNITPNNDVCLFVYIVHLEWFQTHLLPKYLWQVSCGSKRNSKAFRYCASPLTALFGSTKRQSSAKIEDVRLPVRMYLPPTLFEMLRQSQWLSDAWGWTLGGEQNKFGTELLWKSNKFEYTVGSSVEIHFHGFFSIKSPWNPYSNVKMPSLFQQTTGLSWHLVPSLFAEFQLFPVPWDFSYRQLADQKLHCWFCFGSGLASKVRVCLLRISLEHDFK